MNNYSLLQVDVELLYCAKRSMVLTLRSDKKRKYYSQVNEFFFISILLNNLKNTKRIILCSNKNYAMTNRYDFLFIAFLCMHISFYFSRPVGPLLELEHGLKFWWHGPAVYMLRGSLGPLQPSPSRISYQSKKTNDGGLVWSQKAWALLLDPKPTKYSCFLHQHITTTLEFYSNQTHLWQ